MKKILFRRNSEGDIYSVESFDRYIQKGKTDDEIMNMVNEFNNKEGVDVYKYQVKEVEDDDLADILCFLLGDKQYKKTHDIGDICLELNSVGRQAESLEYDLSDMVCTVEEVKDNLNKICDKLKEKFGIYDD